MDRKQRKYKSGVAKGLLDLCVGSDLEKNRLAHRDSCSVDEIIVNTEGKEMEAKEWLKSNKKNLNA